MEFMGQSNYEFFALKGIIEIRIKLFQFILILVAFLNINAIQSQILTEKTELKKQLSEFSYFPNNPCEIQNEIILNFSNKVAHFLRFESCEEDKTKLKGILYGIIVIDDTLYKISSAHALDYFFGNEDFIKSYRKLDKMKKTILENTNRQFNLDYYNKIREENRKAEEKIRLEEEEKRKVEEEIKRKEEERLAQIKAKELTEALDKGLSDSLTNEELKSKLTVFRQFITSQDSLVDSKIKNGIKNGGILITQFNFYVSDYGVVDLTLGIQNLSKKRIKYVSFTLQPFNSVDDPVEYENTFKGIGFIEPNTEGVWDFENAWFSDVIEYLELKSITVVFEDGTTKQITKIGEIRVDDDEQLVESIIKGEKKIIHQIGSIALVEYLNSTESIAGFCIYSILDKELKVTIIPEENIIQTISDLKDIVIKRKQNTSGKVGSFEITPYTSSIYFFLDEGYCLISLNEAELLLTKLMELFPG
jgi:hypothetical protein